MVVKLKCADCNTCVLDYGLLSRWGAFLGARETAQEAFSGRVRQVFLWCVASALSVVCVFGVCEMF